MSIPTNAVSTELDAVNQILSSVGQAPGTTLNLQNPEVAIVLTTLREVNKQVQAEVDRQAEEQVKKELFLIEPLIIKFFKIYFFFKFNLRVARIV